VKPSTISAYTSIVNASLIPAFGGFLLSPLSVEAVNTCLAEHSKLKPKTLRNHLLVLNKILEDAREAGHLAVNGLRGSTGAPSPQGPECVFRAS